VCRTCQLGQGSNPETGLGSKGVAALACLRLWHWGHTHVVCVSWKGTARRRLANTTTCHRHSRSRLGLWNLLGISGNGTKICCLVYQVSKLEMIYEAGHRLTVITFKLIVFAIGTSEITINYQFPNPKSHQISGSKLARLRGSNFQLHFAAVLTVRAITTIFTVRTIPTICVTFAIQCPSDWTDCNLSLL
jgi:hypothetical protein